MAFTTRIETDLITGCRHRQLTRDHTDTFLRQSVSNIAVSGAMTAEGPSERAQVRLVGDFATQYDIEFRDLRFSVPSKKSGKPHTLILKGVSGYCRSARLTAIMGASGAGEPGLLFATECQLAHSSHACSGVPNIFRSNSLLHMSTRL